MPEVQGTVDRMSPTGKGFKLKEYENWWNFGKKYAGPRPFVENAAITVTYEETFKADGTSGFFVLSAGPTTGQTGPVPPQVTPPGPTPTTEPKPTNGPTPTQPAAVEPVAVGPTPTPPNRENYILYECCLARAQEWVLATEPEGGPQRLPAHVLFVADLYYVDGLKAIKGDRPAPPQSYEEYQQAAQEQPA